MSFIRKTLFATGLAALLATCTEAPTSGELLTSRKSCRTDYDCLGAELCIDSLCNGSGNGSGQSCNTDFDCPGEEICESYACISSQTNPNGSSSAKPPQEVFKDFTETLLSGDVERSLSYFDPSARETYRSRLEGGDLRALGRTLQNVQLIESNTTANRKEYDYVLEGIEYPLIFYLEEKGWKIHGI